jgi:uncharacterized protein with von Willebrand factor type A (vWA) domain
MNGGAHSLVAFAAVLRSAGVPANPEAVRTFFEAAPLLPPEDLYWAGRATLVTSPEHIPIYDAAFLRCFGRDGDDQADQAVDDAPPAGWRPPSAVADDGDETGDPHGTASPVERLSDKHFSRLSEEEWAQLVDLMLSLPALVPRRRARRYARGGPGPVDARRLLRSASRTGGEPFHLPRRHRRQQPRSLVFVLDVSGSMAAYSRALMLFAHAVAHSGSPVEAHAFGTRLTDLTEAVGLSSFDSVLEVARASVPDWDGGTRIGDAFSQLLDDHGTRTRFREAIVVICSDGLDTGDPEFLAIQTERLQRTVHRVVWLNPLKGDEHYQPLARGMRAALAHVDDFASCHNLNALRSAFANLV